MTFAVVTCEETEVLNHCMTKPTEMMCCARDLPLKLMHSRPGPALQLSQSDAVFKVTLVHQDFYQFATECMELPTLPQSICDNLSVVLFSTEISQSLADLKLKFRNSSKNSNAVTARWRFICKIT